MKKADGNYDKHKCRLVLCGHKGFMIAGKHYQETYSATVDTATSKLIQVLALIYGWDRASWDVDTAYLQSDSEFCTQIAMRYPKGWEYNSRLHLSSAFRTGNLLFAYYHTDVGWYRTALPYRGCSVLLRNCTDTGAGCY